MRTRNMKHIYSNEIKTVNNIMIKCYIKMLHQNDLMSIFTVCGMSLRFHCINFRIVELTTGIHLDRFYDDPLKGIFVEDISVYCSL